MDVVDYSDDEEFLGGSQNGSTSKVTSRGVRHMDGSESSSSRAPSAPGGLRGHLVMRVPMPPPRLRRPVPIVGNSVPSAPFPFVSETAALATNQVHLVNPPLGKHARAAGVDTALRWAALETDLRNVGFEVDTQRPIPMVPPHRMGAHASATRDAYYRNDAIKRAVQQQQDAQEFIEKTTVGSTQSNDVSLRHKKVLVKRQILGQPTGYNLSSGAGATTPNLYSEGGGDVMRKGAGVSSVGLLSAADLEARDVLGLNIQMRSAGRRRRNVVAYSSSPTHGVGLPTGIDELDPAVLAKFRKRGRHRREPPDRGVCHKYRSSSDDFTSSSEDADAGASVAFCAEVPVVPLTANQISRNARKDAIRADVELTLMQYRAENRTFPDEGGRSPQTQAGTVDSHAAPFAALHTALLVSEDFSSAPKSSKGGGARMFGGHMSFCAAIYAILFCVKIKGRLGHETQHEIRRAFDREAAEGQLKRLQALSYSISGTAIAGGVLADPLAAPGVAKRGGGGYVTPRKVGGPPLAPHSIVPTANSAFANSIDGGMAAQRTLPDSPRVTARGALLQGRQQFSEMKRLMATAISTSAQRMQHAKKQHCTAQLARALGSHSLGACSHHGGDDGTHGVVIKSDTNPFAATVAHNSHGAGEGIDATTKLSQFLFDEAKYPLASAGSQGGGEECHAHEAPNKGAMMLPEADFVAESQSRRLFQSGTPHSDDNSGSDATMHCVPHQVVGQRNFFVLHSGWVDHPFEPPALVHAADYVPQARDSKLRSFTRPESPLLPVIERLGAAAAERRGAPRPQAAIALEVTSPKRSKRGILRPAQIDAVGILPTSSSGHSQTTASTQHRRSTVGANRLSTSPRGPLALTTQALEKHASKSGSTLNDVASPKKQGIRFQDDPSTNACQPKLSVLPKLVPIPPPSPRVAFGRQPTFGVSQSARAVDKSRAGHGTTMRTATLSSRTQKEAAQCGFRVGPLQGSANIAGQRQHTRRHSVLSSSNGEVPELDTSRRGSVASFASARSTSGGLRRTGSMSGAATGGDGRMEDLASPKPHGKSQVEAQREMIREHKRKRANFIDHTTGLHIQWRKETVAERLAKDYDFAMGAPATFEAFRTASILDHNAFLSRAADEMRRVLLVREQTSFPIKAKTLVAAVENVEEARRKEVLRVRRRRARQRKEDAKRRSPKNKDGSAATSDSDSSDAGPFSLTSWSPPNRSDFVSSEVGPTSVAVEVPATVNPAVSMASAIRSVESIIANTMRQRQLSTIRGYNNVWVDKVRAGILPYVDVGGFTPLEERVFTVFKNYLVSTGGATGVGESEHHPRPPRSRVLSGDGKVGTHHAQRRASNASVSAALPTVSSAASLRRALPADPVVAAQRLFRRVLSQNFTSTELGIPNIQFLLMRMLPLFPGLSQADVIGFLRDRGVPFHLVTGEFEAIFSAYVADADDAHRRLKERRIDRHLAFHANVSRKLERVERVVRAEKGV